MNITGKEYDFVFTIDNEDGKPPLNLPYNLTEDPWFAARKFIDDNDLSDGYLETIADFIIENTKGAEIGLGKPSEYADPFTGGGRYQPDGQESTTAGGHDPYTGSGRYKPDTTGSNTRHEGTDPFTGGGRYMPTAADGGLNGANTAVLNDQILNPSRYTPGDDNTMQVDEVIKNSYFPKESYILFESCNVVAMLDKLKEFGSKCGNDVTDTEMESFKRFTHSNASPTASDMELLWQGLHWPNEFVFPVLDLLRFSISCQPATTQQICQNKAPELLVILLTHIRSSVPANRLLSIRILNNLFKSPDGNAFLLAGCSEVIDSVCSFLPSDPNPTPGNNKNIQVTVATLFINYGVLIRSASRGSPAIEKIRAPTTTLCIRAVVRHLEKFDAFVPEAIFRHLVAIGTLIASDQVAIQSARSLNAQSIVKKAADYHHSTDKIQDCSKFLIQILN